MQKLFRFKYEKCNETAKCYAFCSKLMTELRKLPELERQSLVNVMVEAHNKLCDNPDYSFGLDTQDNIFVGHFRTPSKTDLYYGKDFKDTILDVCRDVMKEDIPHVQGNCCFGDNGAEDLGREILKYCEDVAYNQILESHCECKTRAA